MGESRLDAAAATRHDAPVPRLQRKSFEHPDTVRTFPFGRLDVINLDEMAIGRFVCRPGWRWSDAVKPLMGTDSCQLRHIGYVIAGTLHVQMDDGIEVDIRPNDAYEIPPGHDAWVVGDVDWDTVEFTSGRVFAAPAEDLGERTLATILFTDIVEFDRDAGPHRGRRLAPDTSRPQHPDAWRPRPSPRPGDRHDRRRVPGPLRRRGPSRPLCC